MPEGYDVFARPRAMQDVPPPEAWIRPEKWLRFEGGIAVGMNPDVEKLDLPLDDRGLIIAHEAIRMVRGLFKPEYIWEYSAQDILTKPDVHHWYGTKEDYESKYYDGYLLPKRFRNQASNLLYSQRMFHNTIHRTTNLLPIPEMSAMEESHSNYQLAFGIFTRILESAKRAQTIKGRFETRRRMLAEEPDILLNGASEEIGEAILRSEFAKNFAAYSRALEEANVTFDYLVTIGEEYAPHAETLHVCSRGLRATIRHSDKLLGIKRTPSIVADLMRPAA